MMPEIIHETVVAGRPQQVVVALTTAEGLAAFYTDQVRAQPSELWFGFISSTAAGGRRKASSARALSSGRKSSTGSTATSRRSRRPLLPPGRLSAGHCPKRMMFTIPTRPGMRDPAVAAYRVDDRSGGTPHHRPRTSLSCDSARSRSRCRFTRTTFR